MRKIKKINGFLVVRFNDREKRLNEGTGLGSFGVIDAEDYTGILDIDRDLMEYDSADTLEEAIEQARGLASEQDVVEPQVKITIVKESDTGSSEEEVDPVSLFQSRKAALEHINVRCNIPGLDDVTTTQQMYGYAYALFDLGIADLEDERFQVDPALPPELLSVLSRCDKVNDLNHLVNLLNAVGEYSQAPTSDERFKRKPDLPFQPCDKGLDRTRPTAEQMQKEQGNFLHPPSDNQIYPKIYALGMRLQEDCPENDCIIFRNTFQMCLEADAQLDKLTGFPRRWLSKRIEREYRYLEQMFAFNSAVNVYREQHSPCRT